MEATMIQQGFEIKVALIGNVSAGKTTILNALFKAKYSEVSMKRTTAGINFFRVYVNKNTSKGDLEDTERTADSSDSSEAEAMEWTAVTDEPRTATSTLAEITADNAVFRDSDEVHEKHFDIELEEDLCEMRKDTKLVIVDIPGVNEAGASRKYRDYVKDKWNTFDCVVVVMDAKQGVNTEEQVELLNDVKANNHSKKSIPVIILCNKVDDPEDEEQAELVREARAKVEEVFGVNSRTKALRTMLNDMKHKRTRLFRGSYPVFLPLSAVNAFIYQSAQHMTLEQFKKFDKDLIERLGKEQIGKRLWNRMSYDAKVKATFELIISDPEQYQEGLKASNFDRFLSVLSYSVGGDKNQSDLIEKQIVVGTGLISSYTPCMAAELKTLYRKRALLSSGAAGEVRDFAYTLISKFKQVYRDCEDAAFQQFEGPADVNRLARPMLQLVAYRDLAMEYGWDAEKDFAASRMEHIVRRQIAFLLEKEADTGSYGWATLSAGEAASWNHLSDFDWASILGSISLLSYDEDFCQRFGEEKMMLDRVVAARNEADRAAGSGKGNGTNLCVGCKRFVSINECGSCCIKFTVHVPEVGERCGRCSSSSRGKHRNLSDNGTGKLKCNHCGYVHQKFVPVAHIVKTGTKRKFAGGKFVPVDAEKYKKIVHYETPKSFSDPKHFGHLAWLFCEHIAE